MPKIPSFSTKLPVKVFAPANVTVPVPCLTIMPAPEIGPLIVDSPSKASRPPGLETSEVPTGRACVPPALGMKLIRKVPLFTVAEVKLSACTKALRISCVPTPSFTMLNPPPVWLRISPVKL